MNSLCLPELIPDRVRKHVGTQRYIPRKFARQPMEIPAIVSWRSLEGACRLTRAHTRDLSPSGVFVVTTEQPPVGSVVDLTVFLPPLSAYAPSWLLHLSGRVVRVDRDPAGNGKCGFAAESDDLVVRARERRQDGSAFRKPVVDPNLDYTELVPRLGASGKGLSR
jgi:hypothetical protein